MPVARFQLPDGRIARFEVPEGTTPEAAQQLMQNYFDQQQSNPASAGGMGGQPAPQHQPWGPPGSAAATVQDFLNRGPAPDNPTVQALARGTGLAAGALAKGVTGTSGMLSDAAYGLLGGQGQKPSARFAGLFPQPQGVTEKVLDFAGQTASGMMGDPLARALQQRYAPNAAAPRQPTDAEREIMDQRAAGFRFAPSDSKASTTGQVLEGLANKQKLARDVAKFNAGVGMDQAEPRDIAQFVTDAVNVGLRPRRLGFPALAMLTGHPTAAAGMMGVPAAQYGLRRLLMSEAGQRMFVDPKLAAPLYQNPAVMRAMPAATQALFQ